MCAPKHGPLFLQRRRRAIHDFIGRRRERERQIRNRRQRLAFPFAVDFAQQRIEAARTQPLGEFDILQHAEEVVCACTSSSSCATVTFSIPGRGLSKYTGSL